jgi:hypothetical protein
MYYIFYILLLKRLNNIIKLICVSWSFILFYFNVISFLHQSVHVHLPTYDTWNWLNYINILKIKHNNIIYSTQLCKLFTKHIIKIKIVLTMLAKKILTTIIVIQNNIWQMVESGA